MRRIFAAMLLVTVLAVPARAQAPGSPEAVKAAGELFAILGGETTRQMSTAMIAQMWPELERELAGKISVASLQEIRAELERSLTTFVNDAMTEGPAIYARYFSAPELRDMAAFYRTPTGVKALQLLPKVTADIGGLIIPRLPVFHGEIAGKIQAIMKKHGYK
jgi:uncharacterized protein